MSQFPALGGLQLAFNEVTWRELNRLRHMHILNLMLLGNPQLDCDPNCKNTAILLAVILCMSDRQHVISMLPHVWMLDGMLITGKWSVTMVVIVTVISQQLRRGRMSTNSSDTQRTLPDLW